MKKNNFFLIIIIAFILIISSLGSKGESVENLDTPIGLGYDVEISSNEVSYIIYALVYSFEENNKILPKILTSKANTLGETREVRQLITSKRFLLGLNRVILLNETTAKFGLKNFIDIWINNPEVNDRCICVVCNGKSKDLLEYTPEGYTSSADYIEGLIKNGTQFNFFSKEYSITNMIVRMDAEGRTTLLPYIELTKEGIKNTGLAIFNGDKMILKADIKNTKIINILKENNVKGILTLQNNPNEYINFYATSKRKITCIKEGQDKYKFTIKVNLSGSIISNQLYKQINKDPQEVGMFEKAMSDKVKKMCNDTIKTIQTDYKVDVLDLGRIAAAKYGRGTGVDWNKIISNSDIEVIVNVKLDTEGRGNF